MDNSDVKFVLGVKEIEEILPHRGAFLLIDSVCDYHISDGHLKKGSTISAIYQVPTKPIWFDHHFPNNPVMPGVLILEMANQTAAILFHLIHKSGLCTLSSYERANVRKPVFPGEVLKAYIILIAAKARIGKAQFKVVKIVGDQEVLVSDGEVYGMVVQDIQR